ncbi:PepSY domain-containing protein [Pseudomonas matsuisoli]|uniref:PepSY domain-containing protein n=1 Tax=Pseudomonas matsuisoli TaxID=1515666 RepID=A0A917PM10_9PSED|nr:PepSY domain-containing protein [Pseudomonas matsuisoli]GGJ84140.1 hypothetical protein GCM10009304_07650 [Pseudomonas matsuisoli]
MKLLTSMLAAATLVSAAGVVQARDLGPDEALRLRDAGTIQSFEKLNDIAVKAHPGAKITDTELEEEYGRFVYEVELRDAKNVEWDLAIDAKTGEVLKNHQDD